MLGRCNLGPRVGAYITTFRLRSRHVVHMLTSGTERRPSSSDVNKSGSLKTAQNVQMPLRIPLSGIVAAETVRCVPLFSFQ